MARYRRIVPFCLLAGETSAGWLDEGTDCNETRFLSSGPILHTIRPTKSEFRKQISQYSIL